MNFSRLRQTISRLLCILSKAQFSSPPRSDLVIYDREGADVLESMVLEGMQAFVLPVRGERYYLSFAVLWRMFRNRHRYPEGIRHLMACLDTIRPKLVVTYIDNCVRFQKLSTLFPDIAFFAVQNGNRIAHDVAPVRHSLPAPQITLQDFFCFGEWDEQLYSSYGHRIDRFHKIGSVRLSRYRTDVMPAPPPEHVPEETEFDLCLISNFRYPLCEGRDEDWPDWLHCMRHGFAMMHEFIARYVRESGRSICVAGASTAFGNDYPAREEMFFRSLLPGATFIHNDKKTWSTFRAIERSRLSFCYHSTAGFEALALGRRVLFCNYTGDEALSPPWPGPWLTTESDYQRFAAATEALLSTPISRFREQSEPLVRHMFGDFPKFDGASRLRRAIRERLEAA